MSFRVVQVGLGLVAHRWIQNALDHPDVDIVAVVDIDEAAARRAIEPYGLAWPVFTSLPKAIEETAATLVFDTTASTAHAEVTAAALTAGCDVFGEKPMVDDEDAALHLLDLVESTGRTFSVMQNRRHHPGVAAIRGAVDCGQLGRLGLVSADYFRPGPDSGFRAELPHQLVLDMGVHAFDTARAFLDADPVRVTCVEVNPPGSWTRGNAALTCVVEFDNGTSLSYRASWLSVGCMTTDQQSWRLTGTLGSVLWDGEGEPVVESLAADAPHRYKCDRSTLPLAADPSLPAPKWAPELPDVRLGTSHREGLAEMLAALRAGRPSQTDCRRNFPTVAAVFAAMRSASERTTVDVTRLPVSTTIGSLS